MEVNFSDFYTLVQLIAGVNFAFIIGRFLYKILDNAVAVDSLIDKSINEFNTQWAIDQTTLGQLQPVSVASGANNEQQIIDLKRKGETLFEKIKDSINKIREYQQDIRERKGFQALFLSVSIYSVCSLSLMAWITHSSNLYIALFGGIYSLLFLITLLYRIYRIFWKKVRDSQKENFCSLLGQVCIILLAIICVVIYSRLSIVNSMPDWYFEFLRIAFITIPFTALIVGFLYALGGYLCLQFKLVKLRRTTGKERKGIMSECDDILRVLNKLGPPSTAPILR